MGSDDAAKDVSRRHLGAWLGTLGGAIGLSALTGCAGDANALEATASGADALVGTTFRWADTIGTAAAPGDLRNLRGSPTVHTAVAGGFWAIGDGGGGVFQWDPASTAPDDGGTVINPRDNVTGRWKRVYSGPLNVRWFGAKGDGTTDDFAAIADLTKPSALSAATAAGGGTVYLPTGNYAFGTTIVLHEKISLVGDGQASTLTFTGAGPGIQWQPTTGIGAPIHASVADLQLTTKNLQATVGVAINDAWRGVMRNVYVNGTWTVAGVTLQGFSGNVSPAQNCAFFNIVACSILGCSGDGIRLLGQVFTCGVWQSSVSGNGGWGVNAALPPLGGATGKSQFSVYACDLEGNEKGGVTGSFVASEIVGNYYEPTDCASGSTCPASAPFVSIPAGQQCYALAVRGNYVSGWWGPYGVDIDTGSGVAGFVLEGNFFGVEGGAAVAAVRLGGVINGRVKSNLFGNALPVEVWGTNDTNDFGLQLRHFRFTGSASTPGLLAPVAGGAPGFDTGIPLPAGGYVVAATVMLSAPPGSSVADVQVQATQPGSGAPVTVIDFSSAYGYPSVGVPITGPSVVFEAGANQGVILQCAALGASKLAAGSTLAVNVASTNLAPGVGIVVDVVVGLGEIGM